MNLILVATIAGASSIVVAIVGMVGARVKRDLDACERDRRMMRHMLHLFVGAIVGVVPERERLKLIEAAAEFSLGADDETA